MKKKLGMCSVLTALLLLMSGSMPAYAADTSYVGADADLGTELSLMEETIESYYGTSYDVFLLGMNCECDWTRNSNNTADQVHAMTSYSENTVMITSKAYDAKTNGKLIGSGGSSGGSVTSTTYTASGIVIYSYQEHSAPVKNVVAKVFLYRY